MPFEELFTDIFFRNGLPTLDEVLQEITEEYYFHLSCALQLEKIFKNSHHSKFVKIKLINFERISILNML